MQVSGILLWRGMRFGSGKCGLWLVRSGRDWLPRADGHGGENEWEVHTSPAQQKTQPFLTGGLNRLKFRVQIHNNNPFPNWNSTCIYQSRNGGGTQMGRVLFSLKHFFVILFFCVCEHREKLMAAGSTFSEFYNLQRSYKHKLLCRHLSTCRYLRLVTLCFSCDSLLLGGGVFLFALFCRNHGGGRDGLCCWGCCALEKRDVCVHLCVYVCPPPPTENWLVESELIWRYHFNYESETWSFMFWQLHQRCLAQVS